MVRRQKCWLWMAQGHHRGAQAIMEMPAPGNWSQRWPEGAPLRRGQEGEGEAPAGPFTAFHPDS